MNDAAFLQLLEILDDHYGSAAIGALYAAWLRAIHRKEARWMDEEIARWAQAANRAAPDFERIVALALIYTRRDLFLRLLNALPKPARQTFNLLAWHGEQRLEALAAALGAAPLKASAIGARGEIDEAAVDWLFFFAERQKMAGRAVTVLSLPDILRRHLKGYLAKPAGYRLAATPEPTPAEFRFLETGIEAAIPLCLSFMAQGYARFDQTGRRLLRQTVRKFERRVGLREFFADDVDVYGPVRAHLTLALLKSVDLDAIKVGDAARRVQNLFEACFQGLDTLGLSLSPHLRGRRLASHSATAECGRETGRALRTVFDLMPIGGWIDVAGVQELARLRDLRFLAFDPSRPGVYYCRRDDSGRRETLRVAVDPRNYQAVVSEPLLKAHLFLAAAFGLLEITYNRPGNPLLRSGDDDCLTPYDGLSHIRLTEWGAYILGRRTTRPAGSQPQPSAPILDDQALIIALPEADQAKRLNLTRFARPISGNRYIVDYAAFLANAAGRDEINAHIESFRQTVCRDPPQIWERFFDAVRAMVEPFSLETGWRVFKTAQDPSLAAALARDPILRELVVRAEGRRVLIHKKNFSRVKKKLQEYGYLITG